MTETIRTPGDLHVPVTILGRFSARDIARFGLPVLGLGLVGSRTGSLLLSLGLGVVLGTLWCWWHPYDRPFDRHAFHALRWGLRTSVLDMDDGITVTDDCGITDQGTAVAVIEVDPTNLEMQSGDEQRALHNVYREFLASLTYPVTVHSIQEAVTLTDYIQTIDGVDTDAERLRDSYVEHCRTIGGESFITTNHYVVVSHSPSTLSLVTELWHRLRSNEVDEATQEAVQSELDNRCREIVDALDTADLTAERVTGTEFEHLLARHQPHTPFTGVTYFRRSDDGDYHRSLVVDECPSNVELAWPAQVLRTDGLVDTTQVIRPQNAAKVTRKLQRINERIEAEITSFLASGYRGFNKLEALQDDVEWFLDLLTTRQDHPVEYSVTLTAHGETRRDCDRAFDKLDNHLQTRRFDAHEPVFRTDHALHTHSLASQAQLDDSLLVPAGSAAAGFPFTTHDLDTDYGVLYGVDTSDETPILVDRFQWASHSMARMGTVGSGKSYATKLELLRSHLAYPGLDIYVVDPKQEYKHVIRHLNGSIHTLEQEKAYSFDDQCICFTVPERGQDGNADLLKDAVQQIYAATAQNTDPTLVIIDEARILLNDEHGRQILNQFVLEGRDTNTAVTLVTQNASHFTHCREGREILDNMPGKVFMRHDRVPDSVVDYFDLSQRERQRLYELKTGTDADYSEALLNVSGRLDATLRIDATPREDAIITAGEEVDHQ